MNNFTLIKIDWKRLAIPFLLCLASAVFTIVVFYPGFMSYDSFVQLKQALGQLPYFDSHPVIMAKLWGALIFLTGGNKASLFIFYVSIYWLAVYLLSTILFRKQYLIILSSLLIGFFPPAYFLSLHNWKDVGMLISFYFFVIFIILYLKKEKIAYLGLSSLCLIVATLMRTNAFVASLPLFIYTIYLLSIRFDRLSIKFVYSVLYILLVVGVFLGTTNLLNHNARHVSTIGTVLVWDMGAVSKIKQTDYLPLYLHRKQSVEDDLYVINRDFSPDANYHLFKEISPYPNPEDNKKLVLDWFKLITKEPVAYLQHRLKVFETLLNLDGRTYYPLHPWIDENDFGMKFHLLNSPTYYVLFQKVIEFVTNSIFYKNYFYFFVGLSFLIFLLFCKKGIVKFRFLCISLLISGLCNTASLFILAPAADYRYCVWSSCSVVLACFIYLTSLKKKTTEIRSSRDTKFGDFEYE